MSFIDQIIQSAQAMSGWEAVATLLGLAYLTLAIKESIWAWPCAFVSTLIYTVIFWEGQLPLQSLLNVFYLGMAVYGFWLWRRPKTEETHVDIHRLSWKTHLLLIGFGVLISGLIAAYLIHTGTSKMPYLDAGVTVFSVLTTILTARKVLENWLYWVVVDGAAIALYWQTGFYFTMVLMAVYVVMVIIGFFEWLQLYRQAQTKSVAESVE
ncbi:nicotinamide riboside transporter PnuC [Hydrogenovibrio kuenenii]|uniref:nicotinamide riboside transporter PnuC n=1 Tax=Hydrogenovibrio kuenenii TaxID=63658 RepID=UPI000467999F|nr:nicotinamide riboside transporter PnuC [Hydrogenovibrio kuenenii]